MGRVDRPRRFAPALVYIACVSTRLSSSFGLLAGRVDLPGWAAYLGTAAICGLATLLAQLLARWLDPASLVLVFLLATVLCAAWFGRGPALLAAALSVLLFNLVFVPPRFSLEVTDQRFFFTFAVMLVVGLVVGQLTAMLRGQARSAMERERRVGSLYDVSRELGRALATVQVDEVASAFLRTQFGAATTLWVKPPGEDAAKPDVPDDLDRLARWVMEHGQPAGQGTGKSPEHPALVLPLRGTMAVRGAVAVQRDDRAAWTDDERRLLDTCATLIGSALERIHYIEVARASAVQIEGERLRNSLLSAISHDLRTPLASLVGLADSLRLTRPPPTGQQLEIADAMAASARRMSAMVHNLLDMARLEAGTVRLNQEWQPIEEVIGSAVAATGTLLDRHRVSVRLADELPLVRLDAVLMERVLVNLLENAAKYTPAGSTIEITAALHGDEVELCVADDGPGMPAGRAEDLFRKFERGVRESATPGVGLGLALCRSIVAAHGGRIHAETRPGGGARFVMGFPRGEPPAVPLAEGGE